jgi:hypothetical protein
MKRAIFLAVLLIGAPAATAKPFKFEQDSKALEFSYEWSAEAAAIPALNQRFQGDLQKALREARANAREDQQLARRQKRDFNAHDYSMKWTTAGQSPRLLSLQSDNGSFEGGAHPNETYGALLWDRSTNRAVSMASLFLRTGDFSALTRSVYCRRLDAERKKRRQGEPPSDLGANDPFNQCPKYSDLAIAPLDRNRNGRFDTISFVASPYVAGPYVEGEYRISIPVTERLMAALRPEYRGSFEPQRQ